MKTNYNKISNNTIGKQWLKQGWEIFKSNPWIWLGIIIATAIMVGILNRFGIIGRLAASIVTPVFAGGIFLTLEKNNRGEPIEFMDLFSAFKTDNEKVQLLILGAIGIGVVIINMLVWKLFGPRYSARSLLSIGSYLSFAMILNLVINATWAMAMSFSVPLIVLRKLNAIEALKLSIQAVLANIVPMLVYFLMLFAVMIIAMIPFGLGMLIAMPVIFCANYAVFSSIFNNS